MSLGLGTAVAYLTLDSTGFARGIDMAILDAKRLDTGFESVSNTATKVGNTIAGVGTILTAGITAPIVGFGAAAIKSGAEFDRSMSDVRAVSESAKSDIGKVEEAARRLGVSYEKGATDSETAFNALRATAIKMGNETKFTANESANALYYMGLAGWNAEQMISGIPGILALASAGNAELAATSDIVTDAITGFGHSADEMVNVLKNGVNEEIPIATRLADIMAATMANSNTDVMMLGEAFKYVSPIAGSFGYSMEDVSLSLGLMANAGVKASQAGTTLRQGLKRLVAPTDKAQASMEKYGWSAYDAAGNTKPLRQQLQELRKIFGNLNIDVMNTDGTLKTSEQIMEEYGQKLPINDQERLTDAVNVFGTTALPGMLALMTVSEDSFQALAGAIDTSSSAFDGLGYAAGMQAVQLDNLQGDWTLFTSALGTTKQIIFDMANGPLRELVQGLTNLVRKFNEADPATQKMIVKFALLAAAVGPVLLIFGKLIVFMAQFKTSLNILTSGVGLFSKALTALKSGMATVFASLSSYATSFISTFIASLLAGEGAMGAFTAAFTSMTAAIAANPIGLIVVAIGALIAAIGVLIYKFATEEEAIKSVEDAQKSYNESIQETTDALREQGDAVESLRDAQKNLAEVEAETGESGEALYNAIRNGTLGFNDLSDAQLKTYNAYTRLLDVQKQSEEAALKVIDAQQKETAASFEVGAALTKETGNWSSWKNEVVKAWQDGRISTEQTRDLFEKAMTEMSDDAQIAFARDIPSDIQEGMDPSKYETTWQDFKNRWDTLWNIITGKSEASWGEIAKDGEASIGGVKFTWGEVGDWFSDLFDDIVENNNKQTQLIQEGWSAIGDWLDNLGNSLGESIKGIWDGVTELYEEKKQAILDTVEGIANGFAELGNRLSTYFSDMWNTVSTWADNLVTDISTAISGFVDDVIEFFSKLPGEIEGFFSDIWNTISDWASNLVNNVVKTVSDFVDGVVKWFSTLASDISNFIDEIISDISQWVSDLIDKAVEVGTGFVQSIVDWFSQLPDKISEFISSAWNNVSNWASDMINKAVETGSNFINNIVNWFKQLPGKIWEFLSEGISRAGNFVSEMAQKGMSAATSLIQNLMEGAADIGNKVLSIGTDIVNGVWNGIVNAKDTFVSNVKSFFTGMVDGVKSVLGIHSPSTVFRDQVGKNIVLGVSKGIDANKKEATKSLQQMLDEMLKETTYSYNEQNRIVVDRLKKRNKKVNELEQQLQNTTDKNERIKLTRQINRLNRLISNDKQALSIVQSNYIKHCEEQLKSEERYQDLSNKQIEEYWKKVRSQLKKGTNEYDEATKKIVQVQTKTYNQMLQGVEKSLGQMVNVTHISLSEQSRMWVLFSREAKLGSVAYAEAVTKVSDANKDLLQNVTNANNTLTEGIAKTAASVSNSIQSIIESYNSAVASTKETLMGLSGLFEQFTIDESVSGSNLLGNLKTQVQGLEQWNAVIDNMFARGLPQDLIEELQAMGPKAMGSIANLLKMTDTQLNEYIELWNRKNAEAQEAAEKMVDKSTYVEQIREVIKQGNEEVVSLVNEYNETIKQLGLSTQIGAQAASANFVAQFVSMLQGGLSDVDFDALFMLSATPISEKVGLEIVKPINMGIIQGLQKATEQATKTVSNSTNELADAVNQGLQEVVEQATETISNSSDELVNAVNESINESIDEGQVEIKGYKDVGVNIVGNITSGVKDESPKLDNQVRQTGLHSQQEFINSVKSKEKDVNSEGVIVGKQLDDGMASGINMYVGNVAAAAAAAVRAAIDAAKAEAAIASPSKRMANEVGKWLPLGMAKGFVDYTPQAVGQMQDAIDDGISSMQVTDVEILPNVSDISDEIKDVFMNVQDWLLKVAKAAETITNTMKENMQEVVDITDGALYNVDSSSSMNKLISSKNTTAVPVQNTIQNPEGINNNTTNNFVFNSPKPIDEVQASRLLRQTSRDLAEGFG